MKPIVRHLKTIVLAFAFLTLASCSGQQTATQPNSSAVPGAQPKDVSRAGSSFAKNTTFTADPNPIKVCDGSGLGITKLTYDTKGPTQVEVHVGSPNGALLAHTGPTGTATTGKWVPNGMTFYLQDVSGGNATTPDNTLATVTATVTTDGCN
ncbi:MAG: hypothetical protein M3R52_03470 [Acidobacteriota bacterium]|nr:hypothetical protein [Acidobacteriota bacterium]